MNIGIIIYSQTGNTKSVAKKLQDKLAADGHVAEIVQLETVEKVHPGMKDIQLVSLPNVESYDVLVFGSPVQAFSLSVVMKSYLSQMDSLQGRKVALLVTQFFPFPFMGGNQAVGIMQQLCEKKGLNICSTEIIHWSRPNRVKNIEEGVARLSESIRA